MKYGDQERIRKALARCGPKPPDDPHVIDLLEHIVMMHETLERSVILLKEACMETAAAFREFHKALEESRKHD